MSGNKGVYYYRGSSCNLKPCAEQYSAFKRCLPQLIDDESMAGDLTGQWVIFANGWLADYSGFDSSTSALDWGTQLHRDDPGTAWIVARVNLQDHGISPLSLLGDILSDAEFNARPGE